MEFRSWFVRSLVSALFSYCTTVPYSSTDLLYICSKQKHKADHGHKKGHAPRAQEGHSTTGILRPRTEVLRTCTYSSATNTLLRNRASRGHPNFSATMAMRFNEKTFRTSTFGELATRPSSAWLGLATGKVSTNGWNKRTGNNGKQLW